MLSDLFYLLLWFFGIVAMITIFVAVWLVCCDGNCEDDAASVAIVGGVFAALLAAGMALILHAQGLF